MNIANLTNHDLIQIHTSLHTKDEIINTLIEQLDKQDKLNDKKAFVNAVYARESEGFTAMGDGLAIPHGKSQSVKQAAFAIATLKEPILWQGIDGEEKVNLIFLLAIPENEAGSTHMQLLASLSTLLVDETIKAKILAAEHPDEIIQLLSQPLNKDTNEKQINKNTLTIVGVTACPAGIAHTYMAAEYLEKAAKKMGINIYIEKQGANGVENGLTAEQINDSVACIIAADVAIKDEDRFNGIPKITTSVSEPLRYAERIINQAIELSKSEKTQNRVQQTETVRKSSFKNDIKQALLSGISFAVPLIVAGGTVLAITVLVAQIFGLQHLFDTENSWLWLFRKLGGGMLGTLMVSVLSAYTAYSLADKPALCPGFVAGLTANMIGAGFLGGVVGGLIAGYVMRWVKKNIRLSPSFNGFLSFYLYPVLGTLIVGSLMLFVIGRPVAWLNMSLTEWLNGLSGSNALILGAIIGIMCSFDLGGPVNKAAYAFCLGAMANGVYGPYAIFASVKMVSAFTVTAATMLSPKLFKDFEIETGKSTWLLGLAGITEGAIPMAIEDPIRVIGSFLVGSAITGAIVASSGIGLVTPGAGIFSIFMLLSTDLSSVTSALIWFFAAILGTVISTVMLLIWRKFALRSQRV